MFNIGIALTLTDQFSSGVQSAVSSLNNLQQTAEKASSSLNELASLSAFSASASYIGSTMEGIGSTILSSFANVIGKVNDTGQTVMYATQSIGKLYSEMDDGSDIMDKGAEKMAQIQAYAKQSIFNFEDLIPVVRMLKANGIEAFDEISSSTGNSRAMLMDYAADLAAFNPQMKNAYGTGIQAAMGALNEYIAEGNKRLLKSGASLDITSLLGEDAGSTIEERSRQVADLMEQLGMVGMVSNLAGTPMQMLSNMGDVLFTTITKIANSGVYDEFSRIVSKIGEFVFALDDSGEFDKLAQVIADSLVTLMKPVEFLISGLLKIAGALEKIIVNNPFIGKLIVLGTALSGVLLLIGGLALKFMGTAGFMMIGFQNFQVVFKGMTKYMTTFGKTLGGFASKLKFLLGPVGIVLASMALIWKTNFLGIRDTVTGFVDNVKNSFSTAKEAVNGDLSDVQSILDRYDSSHSFFDGLTLAITKVMTLGQALSEGWSNYTLSEETFQKLDALGLTPLIEKLFDLKYRFDLFVEGFKEGWKTTMDTIKSHWEGIQASLDGTIFEKLFDSLDSILGLASSSDAESWKELGTFFGETLATAMYIFLGLFKAVKAVVIALIGAFHDVKTAVETIISAFINLPDWFSSNVIEPIKTFFTDLGTSISTKFNTIKDTVSNTFTSITTTIKSKIDSAKEGVRSAIEKIKGFFKFKWSLPSIKLPHFNITGSFKLKPPSVPKFSVSWYEKGGVFDDPSIIGVGENGQEAVMPLENNTGWIGKLAGLITSEMHSLVPTNNSQQVVSSGDTNSYTTPNTGNTTVEGNTDNSVVFEQGAIQIVANNCSDEEAEQLAKKIMKYIKRQNELNSMYNYA